MGMLSFIKEAGEKLFSKGNAQAAMAQAQANPAIVEKAKAANDAAGDAILDYINSQGLKATGLTVTFDGATHGHRLRHCRRPGDEGKDRPLLRQRRTASRASMTR